MCAAVHEDNFSSQAGPFPFFIFAEWLAAPVRSALLELAVDLDIPGIIAHTGDVKDIAEQLGIGETARLALVLDALTAAGLLHKSGGRYRNSSLSEKYLRRDKPEYLGSMLAVLKDMQHRNISCLKSVLFHGAAPVSTGQALRNEEHWQRSVRGIAAYQKAGMAEALAEAAVSLPGAAGFRHMLDLGCGPGITGLHILGQLPLLRLALCDFPHVLEVAAEEAAASGLEERVSFIPGDYNVLDWGEAYDLIWACQSLYYAQDLHHFLQRIFCALAPGGFFISIHEGVRQEGTEPSLLVLSRLSLALEGQDVSFKEGEIAEAACMAGLTLHTRMPLPMLFGDAILEVFKKPGSS